MKFKHFFWGFIFLLVLGIYGCIGQALYSRTQYIPNEPSWIREGQPILFDNQSWYPTEDLENLTDNEMDSIGKYNDLPLYVEKRQIKPFDRIYTKFGYHKYRVFLRRQ